MEQNITLPVSQPTMPQTPSTKKPRKKRLGFFSKRSKKSSNSSQGKLESPAAATTPTTSTKSKPTIETPNQDSNNSLPSSSKSSAGNSNNAGETNADSLRGTPPPISPGNQTSPSGDDKPTTPKYSAAADKASSSGRDESSSSANQQQDTASKSRQQSSTLESVADSGAQQEKSSQQQANSQPSSQTFTTPAALTKKQSLYDIVRSKQVDIKTNSFDSSKDMKVRLEIIRGSDFPKCDIGPLAKSDPYCIISLWNKQKKRGKLSRGVEMAKTKVHKKTLNPQFNETLEFTIKGYKTSYILIIDVVDWNKIGAGTEMGSIVVDLKNMESNKVYKFKESLGVPFGKKKVLKENASLEFNVTLLSFGADDRQYLMMDHVSKMIRKGYQMKKRKRLPREPADPDPHTYVCGIDGSLPWKKWELQPENIQVGIFHSFGARRRRMQAVSQKAVEK